jgi:MFS family permease
VTGARVICVITAAQLGNRAILDPTLVVGAGLGLLFVPLTVIAMAKVPEAESGVAASLRDAGQQAGGSIGLAVLATIAFTVAAHSAHAWQRGWRDSADDRPGLPIYPQRCVTA